MMDVAYRDVIEAADRFARSDREYQKYLAREKGGVLFSLQGGRGNGKMKGV